MQATAERAMGSGFQRNSDSELKLKNRCSGSTGFSTGMEMDSNPLITGCNKVVAKVIFLHLSVIHSVHRGGLPQCMLGYHPVPHPQEQTSPGSRPPWKQTPPRADTPPPKQTSAYGLQAAGTHPTGMHSC